MVVGGFWENGEMVMGDEFDVLLVEVGCILMCGWEYDYGGCICLELLLWDFLGCMLECCWVVVSLLDMGIGGGEWLSWLLYCLLFIVVIEGWVFNLEIVWGCLEFLGICVVEVEGVLDNYCQGWEGDGGGVLLFVDGIFDLVGNCYEFYLLLEVWWVLVFGGCFFIQQVVGDFNCEFYVLFGELVLMLEVLYWNLGFVWVQLEVVELLLVVGGEGWEVLYFVDVGVLVWYLLNLFWVFFGFFFRCYCECLCGLYESGKLLVVWQFFFWLEVCSFQVVCGQRKSCFISLVWLCVLVLWNRLSRWVFIVGRLSLRYCVRYLLLMLLCSSRVIFCFFGVRFCRCLVLVVGVVYVCVVSFIRLCRVCNCCSFWLEKVFRWVLCSNDRVVIGC